MVVDLPVRIIRLLFSMSGRLARGRFLISQALLVLHTNLFIFTFFYFGCSISFLVFFKYLLLLSIYLQLQFSSAFFLFPQVFMSLFLRLRVVGLSSRLFELSFLLFWIFTEFVFMLDIFGRFNPCLFDNFLTPLLTLLILSLIEATFSFKPGMDWRMIPDKIF